MASNTYIISYQGSKSVEVKAAVKLLGAWFNHFDNQYIVKSNMTLGEIQKALDDVVVQKQDRLLIMQVSIAGRYGWLTQDGWDWLNSQVPAEGPTLF